MLRFSCAASTGERLQSTKVLKEVASDLIWVTQREYYLVGQVNACLGLGFCFDCHRATIPVDVSDFSLSLFGITECGFSPTVQSPWVLAASRKLSHCFIPLALLLSCLRVCLSVCVCASLSLPLSLSLSESVRVHVLRCGCIVTRSSSLAKTLLSAEAGCPQYGRVWTNVAALPGVGRVTTSAFVTVSKL